MSENMSDKIYRSPDQRKADQKQRIAPIRIILDGIIFENPALRLMLGICPLLAVTISAKASLFMGFAVMFVLVGSEFIISLLRNIIPRKVRIPAYITIIAGFVTIVQLLISAYFPSLNQTLGIYIPLIVVNCVVLARSEMFASKRSVPFAVLDGLSMGTGFLLALVLLGSIREILGNGTFFDFSLPFFGTLIEPMMFFSLPPGGFFVYGICICFVQIIIKKIEKHKQHLEYDKPESSQCNSCGFCPSPQDDESEVK